MWMRLVSGWIWINTILAARMIQGEVHGVPLMVTSVGTETGRGRDQEGNRVVRVHALVARGSDSRWGSSWLDLLKRLPEREVALHVPSLLASEALALLHQAIDIPGLEVGHAISTLRCLRQSSASERENAMLHGLHLCHQLRQTRRQRQPAPSKVRAHRTVPARRR